MNRSKRMKVTKMPDNRLTPEEAAKLKQIEKYASDFNAKYKEYVAAVKNKASEADKKRIGSEMWGVAKQYFAAVGVDKDIIDLVDPANINRSTATEFRDKITNLLTLQRSVINLIQEEQRNPKPNTDQKQLTQELADARKKFHDLTQGITIMSGASKNKDQHCIEAAKWFGNIGGPLAGTFILAVYVAKEVLPNIGAPTIGTILSAIGAGISGLKEGYPAAKSLVTHMSTAKEYKTNTLSMAHESDVFNKLISVVADDVATNKPAGRTLSGDIAQVESAASNVIGAFNKDVVPVVTPIVSSSVVPLPLGLKSAYKSAINAMKNFMPSSGTAIAPSSKADQDAQAYLDATYGNGNGKKPSTISPPRPKTPTDITGGNGKG